MTTVTASHERIRIPAAVAACLFDLDGVLTQTAKLHAAAWKEMFDGFLLARASKGGDEFVPFDAANDYLTYVDGREQSDGVRSFLRSRAIDLPDGALDDGPEADTIHGLGVRKNELVLELIERVGVDIYDDSVRFVHAAVENGIRCAVVSSSTNCRRVLDAAGIAHLFVARVDGLVAAREHLAGKPAPDLFVAAARRLGVQPAAAAVFEDSIAGVRAGRAGDFALVVGVDRVGQADALRAHGADLVVSDLTELLEAP